MIERNGHIFTGVPSGNKTAYWISRKGNTDAYYCFTADSEQELNYQLENGIDEYVRLYETNHAKLTGASREFEITTPLGNLRVYSKHKNDMPNDFPGVYIDHMPTGDMLACVEYVHTDDYIQTCVYQPGNDTPCNVTKHKLLEPEEDD